MAGLAPFPDTGALRCDPEALRRRMAEDGFLHLPGLVPASEADAVRREILALCRAHGWADAEGLASGPPRLEGHPKWWEVYDPLQRLECFHALAHHPSILRVVEAVAGAPVLVHPRNIARITFPGAEHFTTPPHQDHPLIQGTPDVFTLWMPLCDCPLDLGGLAVLRGSHVHGLLPVHRAIGPGGLSVDAAAMGGQWHAQRMRAGDALLFHSLTVHRALPNVSGRRLRISVDYRYQNALEPVVEDSLLPHYGRLTWDEIYAEWNRTDLQHYWQRLPLTVVPRDRAIMQPVEERGTD